MLSIQQKAQVTILRGLGYTQQEIAGKLKIKPSQVHYQLGEINQEARKQGDQNTYIKTITNAYLPQILQTIEKINL